MTNHNRSRRKLNPYEKEILTANSNDVTHICEFCKEWLYSDELSRVTQACNMGKK
ncbi:MAG: hypothetical protein WB511_15120 [Nitrososphaeraceae archaeon]